MHKSYKYSKNCAEKLSSRNNSYAEKYHPIVVKKIYTYNFLKVKIFGEFLFQKGNSAAGISPSACSLAEPLYTTPMVLNDFIKRKVM